MGYQPAYERQVAEVEAVLAARESASDGPVPPRAEAAPRRVGCFLVVEHPPVITVSRRPGAGAHLLAGPERLAAEGVELAQTDRGGDITYHGPGQVVVYPILDLNALGLRLHDYMRGLEEGVIAALARWGIVGQREPGATGVWVGGGKICAMGVRVRRWVSMHGLAVNVSTDLAHFDLIVPCGLVGRRATSLRELLGQGCPGFDEAAAVVVARVAAALGVSVEPEAPGAGGPTAPAARP